MGKQELKRWYWHMKGAKHEARGVHKARDMWNARARKVRSTWSTTACKAQDTYGMRARTARNLADLCFNSNCYFRYKMHQFAPKLQKLKNAPKIEKQPF